MLIPKWIPLSSAVAAVGAAIRQKEDTTEWLQIILADGPPEREARAIELLEILCADESPLQGQWEIANELLFLGNRRPPPFELLRLPAQKSGVPDTMLALLSDGSLWAEGIEVGHEPPEYAKISEALWTEALWPIRKALVDFPHSTLRRGPVGIHSIRISTECLEKLWPEPGIVERMRRTYHPKLPNITPFFTSAEAAAVDATAAGNERYAHHTGFAGRPTGKQLIGPEMERRARSGELKSSLRAEAKELADWYAAAHSGAPPARAGTIRNSFADLHRRLVRGGE